MNNKHNHPPKLITWLLRQVCDESYFEEISGDLLEMYADRLATSGKWVASLHYLKDVILSFRNIDLKKKKRKYYRQNAMALLGSNFKITFRTMGRNRMYSALNISGLALGVAAFLFILQYVAYEKSFDQFHPDRNNLYRIRYKGYDEKGVLSSDCAVSAPRVATYMKEKLPEVKAVCRATSWTGLVYSYNNKKFREDRTLITEPNFLTMFNFPLVAGNPATALRDKNSLIISERMAAKYFDGESPIGKVMDIDGYKDYVVTGVAKDPPENSHIRFDFLLSYATVHFWRGDAVEDSWIWYDFYSYVLLQPGANPRSVEQKFARVLQTERKEKIHENGGKDEYFLQPVTDIHLYSRLTKELNPDGQGDGDAVKFLSLIAFFILGIAWINYINLSTARSLERAKEVGVRKTIGAYRAQLIGQFLTESLVMNFLALVLGLATVALGIHYFNLLTHSALNLSFFLDRGFWVQMAILFAVGSMLSGLYPAFVLSSFQPVTALKGKLKARPAGAYLRRGLVVLQFAASIALIIGTVVVYLQLKYMRTKDLGFDMTKTIVVRGPNPVNGEEGKLAWAEHNTTFKHELLRFAGIQEVTSSSNVPGDELQYWVAIRKRETALAEYKLTFTAWVDYEYFSSYRIPFIAGRNFIPGRDDSTAVILNESAARLIGFDLPEHAVDRQVIIGGDAERTVVGVIKDYNQMAAKKNVSPIIFGIDRGTYSYYTVKLAGSRYDAALADIRKTYESFWPKAPFEYFFLDAFYDRQYDNEVKFSNVFTLFAGFAIFVACLGLFGLSSFSALQRTKEIGIRKVLGADVPNIIYLLSKEFILLVLLGNAIAWPFSYWIMDDWLTQFANRIILGFPIFLASGLAVLLTAFLAVGYKTIMTAQSNPVQALKYE